ncbi:MAG TPA: pyroglutamyl-peptidase I [Dokdonella sp.]
MARTKGTPADTLLLTGFEPFGGESSNPSQDIVRALDGTLLHGHRVVGAVLPVAFAPAPLRLAQLIEQHRPGIVLALGQAGGRSELSFERVAINLIDARIRDNEGLQPVDEAVAAGAPAAYFSSLPLKAMHARLQASGIPATLSLSAGSYLCNQVFFVLAHLIATRHPNLRGGFMHVPWLPQQAARYPGQPSMALETMIAGVRLALECAVDTTDDLAVAGGATH